MNQPLVALASPDPSLTQSQSRHTQSELVTILAQRHCGRIRERRSNLTVRRLVLSGQGRPPLGHEFLEIKQLAFAWHEN